MTDARLPNLVYIGPDKAGSTWLHHLLDWHPDAYVPAVKELFYFDRYWERGVRWYARHYEGAQAKVRADISHDYLFDPLVPERLVDVLGPDVRVMVTLREPVDRAWSAYLFMIRQGRVRGTFEEAVEQVPELLDHGRYAHHLVPFLDRLPRRQVHAPLFDELGRSPADYAASLFEFAGLADLPLPDDLLHPRLAATRPRHFGVAKAARSAGVALRDAGGERLVSLVKRSSLVERALYRDLGEAPTQMSPDVRAGLRSRMAPEVAALDELLGTGCAARWGYRS